MLDIFVYLNVGAGKGLMGSREGVRDVLVLPMLLTPHLDQRLACTDGFARLVEKNMRAAVVVVDMVRRWWRCGGWRRWWWWWWWW